MPPKKLLIAAMDKYEVEVRVAVGGGGEGRGFRKKEDVQHIAFPRGPPPQYYRYSRQLNFAVRMGSGDPA